MNLYNYKNGAFDQYLGQLIGSTRAAKAMKAVRENVALVQAQNINRQQLIIQSNGFFLKKNGVPQRTYLYLGSYKVRDYGTLPKKHYFDCEVVQKYSSFSSTNREQVNIYCTQTGSLYEEVVLEVCQYCQRIFQEQTAQILLGESFDEFILAMACQPQNPPVPIGAYGYPVNFAEISTAFRRLKNYTCEKCHLTISDPSDQYYLHTHHIDRNKNHNCVENFQCLCIKCHSEVDELHRRNFDTPEQRRELRAFMEKYKPM